MSSDLIDITDAWKVYHVGEVQVPAVRGVSLQVSQGEFVAITGPSGSGKSTFMHLLGCLDRLSSGTYRFEGQPIQELSRLQLARLRNRRIGFVFQSFNLLARTTIVDNVALPLIYQGVRRSERKRRASELLDRIGLSDRLRHHSNQLSGGQQQRVAIARALVSGPAVLLADEPTGDLDQQNAEAVFDLMQRLHRTHRLTSLLATHNVRLAERCDRVLELSQGILRPAGDARRGPGPLTTGEAS